MAWIKLTRMVERITKDGARGDLRTFGFAGVSALWVRKSAVVAVGTFKGAVYTDEWETEDRDVTEIIFAGNEQGLYVSELVADVLDSLGIPAT